MSSGSREANSDWFFSTSNRTSVPKVISQFHTTLHSVSSHSSPSLIRVPGCGTHTRPEEQAVWKNAVFFSSLGIPVAALRVEAWHHQSERPVIRPWLWNPPNQSPAYLYPRVKGGSGGTLIALVTSDGWLVIWKSRLAFLLIRLWEFDIHESQIFHELFQRLLHLWKNFQKTSSENTGPRRHQAIG